MTATKNMYDVKQIESPPLSDEEIKDVEEFYRHPEDHTVGTLKKLLEELHSDQKLWNLEWTNKFIKQYKKLNSDIQYDVDKAIEDIASSTNPSDLGVYKHDMRIFSYEIGRKHRVIYSIRYKDGIVDLLRVCDHKSVYGKD